MDLSNRIDNCLEKYKCVGHVQPSMNDPHGCTDCYNIGYILDTEEAGLLNEANLRLSELHAELELVKKKLSVHQELRPDEAGIAKILVQRDQILRLNDQLRQAEKILKDVSNSTRPGGYDITYEYFKAKRENI